MSEPLVHRLASFAVESSRSGIPREIRSKALHHILDTIGVAVGGSEQPSARAASQVAIGQGAAGPSTALVTGERMPPASAALVNGTMAHSLDFDDTHLPSVLHPSASVVPVALAVAEAAEASGTDVVTAVAIGDEIVCRLGMGAYDPELGNSVFFENGLHATSICGTLGSAAAAAVLLGATEEQCAHAMSVAASMGAGLLEANRAGGSVKPVHCGWAAHAGIMAAELAMAGLTGPASVLEGRFGFFRAHVDGYLDKNLLIGDLGERWEILKLCIKPYPANHFTHAGIDAALVLKDSLDLGQIVEIELGAPAPVLRTIAEPAEEKARPRSGHHAKFSGPFTIATALVGGSGLGVSNADFTDETARDETRLRLASLVRCVADDQATASFPNELPAVVRIRLQDGTVLEHRIEHVRGGPKRPLTVDDLVTKFHLNADARLGTEQASQAAESILGLERMDSIRPLLEALTV